MAKRKRAAAAADPPAENPAAPIIEAVAESTHMPDDTSFDPAELEKQPDRPKPSQPDPFLLERIGLGDGPDTPQVRLYRNNRYQQVAIVFDEKPDPEVIAKLRESGFRWRSEDSAWTKQMDREARWKTQLDAERLFRDIANTIRERNGLGPVMAVGG